MVCGHDRWCVGASSGGANERRAIRRGRFVLVSTTRMSALGARRRVELGRVVLFPLLATHWIEAQIPRPCGMTWSAPVSSCPDPRRHVYGCAPWPFSPNAQRRWPPYRMDKPVAAGATTPRPGQLWLGQVTSHAVQVQAAEMPGRTGCRMARVAKRSQPFPARHHPTLTCTRSEARMPRI